MCAKSNVSHEKKIWWITPAYSSKFRVLLWFDVGKLKFMNNNLELDDCQLWVNLLCMLSCVFFLLLLLPFIRGCRIVRAQYRCHSICEYFDRRKLISNQLNEITQFYKVYAVIKTADVLFFHGIALFFSPLFCSRSAFAGGKLVRNQPQIVVCGLHFVCVYGYVSETEGKKNIVELLAGIYCYSPVH